MLNAGLDEAQAEIKIAERNINNLKYADDTTLMTESKEELKSPLMKVIPMQIPRDKCTSLGVRTTPLPRLPLMCAGPVWLPLPLFSLLP